MHRFCNPAVSGLLIAFSLFGVAVQMSAAEDADFIIRARYVVTMDASHRVVAPGAVAIKADRIVAVGTPGEVSERYTSKHVIERPNALLMPGMIDTHTHAPMSLFRGIADDKRLDDWLNHYIFPAESKNVTPDFVRWGTRLACLEMIRAGITTYTDMYYFEDVEAETAKQAGVRGVLGQTIIGFPAPDYKTWKDAIDGTEKFMQKYQHDELITPAIAPHAIYTTPDDALVAAHQLAVKYSAPLLIHLSETQKERDDSLTKRNLTPTQVLEKLGVLDGRVVVAHGIWQDDSDFKILLKHGVGVAHCPSSNTKLASGVAKVVDMLNMGVAVGLGTDGFAGSNDAADLIKEMDLAAKLQKITREDPTALPAEQALEMATIGGARVLGMQREIGSIEEGKKADLITMSLAESDAYPLYNLYSHIVYASKSSEVEDVFINGKQVMSDHVVSSLNAPEIFKKAEEYGRQVAASVR
jgi:5-methylthioadenosine/S-adenosylhomocysteine deaminase